MFGKKNNLYSYGEGRKRKPSFFQSIFTLIGHLIGSAILFFTLFVIAWCISYGIHFFYGLHQLHPDATKFLGQMEHYFLFFDGFLCLLVVLVGALKFMMELGGAE